MLAWEKIVLGDLNTNCYLVWDDRSKEGVVIDPADDGVSIAEEIQRIGIKLKGILATHGHFDHVLGVLDLKLIFNCPFYCNSLDMFLLERQQETAQHFLKREIKTPNLKNIDIDLEVTDKIEIGAETLDVIKTPGHTPGSVCFYDEKGKLLWGGDLLFAEGVGETTHKYSSAGGLKASILKLKKLDPDTLVLPGHGQDFELRTIF